MPLPVVTRVRSYVLRCPLGSERFYSSQAAFPERNSLLVRVDTDTGVSGWGEGGQYGPAEPVACVIDDVIGPVVIGREVQPRRLQDELYAATRDFGQRGPYIDAISALDTALWDALARALGVPLCDLIGGAHRRSVATYGTGCYYRGRDVLDVAESVRQAAAEAARIVGQGFRALKCKVGLLPVEHDARRVAAIREAIGPDVKLMVDANHAYNVPTAARMCHLLEPLAVTFFEEPVVPEDVRGYAELRRRSRVPIAGGECWFTRFQFLDAFERGAVDVAQPDIAACGGVTEFLRIAALAAAYHVPVVPHAWGSGIALANTLHCVATLPDAPHTANPVALENGPVVEFDRNPNPLRDDLLSPSFRFELDAGGRLSVPTGPGLGVTVNEDVLRKYTTRTGSCPTPGARAILAPTSVAAGESTAPRPRL